MPEPARITRLRQEIEQFLFREAWLLDNGRFDEWVELFTDDARYWMPVRERVQGRDNGLPLEEELALPIFDDDKAFLLMRVKRLHSGFAHAEQPPSRTRHLVTNIWIDGGVSTEVTVRSNFIVYQVSRERAEDFYIGEREDCLRKIDGEWRIASRKILLDQPVLPRTLSIFV